MIYHATTDTSSLSSDCISNDHHPQTVWCPYLECAVEHVGQFYVEEKGRVAERIVMKRSVVLKSVAVVFSGLLVFLAVVKVKYGMGKKYPNLGANLPTEPFVVEKLIQLDYPPGNLAVAANGDVYFNYHPNAKADRFSLATVFKWSNGKVEPFPSLEAQKDFQGTFGMTIDKQNRIWFIEPASLDSKHTRVSAFDLDTKKRVEFFEFPEGQAKFAEDIRVTADGKYVVMPNTLGSSVSPLQVLSSTPS
jgi:hypothetical protein